jgi:hypothetical protein
MRNVRMIRTEPDLVWIHMEKAVYCETCETVSTSSGPRCGLCGSEQIVRLVTTKPEPRDPMHRDQNLCGKRLPEFHLGWICRKVPSRRKRGRGLPPISVVR